METEYRREIGSQVWHFHRRCFLWPSRFDFLMQHDRPPDQQISDECIALAEYDHKPNASTHREL